MSPAPGYAFPKYNTMYSGLVGRKMSEWWQRLVPHWEETGYATEPPVFHISCSSHALALLPTWFLSLQKKIRTFCCFQLRDVLPWSVQRGVNLHSASAAAEFSNCASKSPRDSADIIVQRVNASSPLQPCAMLGALPPQHRTERSMPPRIQPKEKGFILFKRNNRNGAA